ncbi:MAG: DJ-1/PfpI family protein, partial [Opitutaceae bacterium]|nr:DJ-1/PfpI family protein [Opitutaceae bacterium]
MPTVLTILPEGFEELEAVAPIDLLRRAGCVVTVAALGPTLRVTGRNALVLEADTLLADLVAGPQAPQIPNSKPQIPNSDAGPIINHKSEIIDSAVPLHDCLLLPGGPGVQHLRASPAVRALVARHHAAGSLLAAIC